MIFVGANCIPLLFMVYGLKHSQIIFCVPGDVAAVGYIKMNKM